MITCRYCIHKCCVVEMDFVFPYLSHILNDYILFLSEMPPIPLDLSVELFYYLQMVPQGQQDPAR